MRDVTLVVVEPDGTLLGQLPPFEVATPWWQDIEPIVAVRPDMVVLRLLDVAGSHVTYLASATVRPRDLLPFGGPASWLDDHPLRMPWARPGGPEADLAWASSVIPVTGQPCQVRTWNLSAIWRLPTAAGECWLKCVPPFFAHEAALITALGPSASLPQLVAADGHRILMRPLPGVDGYQAQQAEYEAIISTLVSLQQRGSGLADRVPAWTPSVLRAALSELLDRRGEDRPAIRDLLDGWDQRWAAIDACGIPHGVFHGDAHPGNARIGTTPPVIFDWGDSGWGHPLLDLAVLTRWDKGPVARRWLDLWKAAVPGSDPDRAWALLEPVAVARAAVVFQGFLDQIEPSEHPYHRDDVEPPLSQAEKLLLSGR